MFQDKKSDNFLQKTAIPENGLNGFFGRLARKLIAGAIDSIARIPIIGGIAAQAAFDLAYDLTDGYAGPFWNKTASEYEPTSAEEAIITPWFDNKFIPIFKAIATDLSTALQSPDASVQLAGMNLALTRMCIIKAYHANSNTAGLSASAIRWRSELILETFSPISNLISTTIASVSPQLLTSSVSTEGIANPAFFSPLIMKLTTAYTCTNYRLPLQLISDNPAPVQTITPVYTAPDQTVTPVPATPAETDGTKEKNFLQKNALWIGLAMLYLVTRKKTKKSK